MSEALGSQENTLWPRARHGLAAGNRNFPIVLDVDDEEHPRQRSRDLLGARLLYRDSEARSKPKMNVLADGLR